MSLNGFDNDDTVGLIKTIGPIIFDPIRSDSTRFLRARAMSEECKRSAVAVVTHTIFMDDGNTV